MKEKRGEKGRENIDRLKKTVQSIGVDTPAMGQVKIPDFPEFLRSSSIASAAYATPAPASRGIFFANCLIFLVEMRGTSLTKKSCRHQSTHSRCSGSLGSVFL